MDAVEVALEDTVVIEAMVDLVVGLVVVEVSAEDLAVVEEVLVEEEPQEVGKNGKI